RRRRKDESMSDPEQGHQNEEGRKVPEERDAGHRDRHRDEADRRRRRGTVPVRQDPRGIVQEQGEDREGGEAQADRKGAIPQLLLKGEWHERDERAEDEIEAEDGRISRRGR